MKTHETADTPAVRVAEIELDQLEASPTNPRGASAVSNLAELTASIRVHGVLQPILIRPRLDSGTYEIVAGERRWRASREAGRRTIPARIQELSDQEVAEIQIVENLQRQDLQPLDEAEGYRVLHQKHGYPVEAIAANIGKSKAYVYARLKLCELPEVAKKACRAEALNASIALLIARIPNEKLQKEATKELLGSRYGGREDGISYRDARDLLERNYMLRLSGAPFPRGDAALVVQAGPCTTCPKRTGNQPELFGDVKSADVCTDPACFGAKVDAHWKRRRADHLAAGGKVLAEKEAKVVFPNKWSRDPGSGYVEPDARAFEVGNGQKTYRQLLKTDLPEPVLARNPHQDTIHELVPRSAMRAALKKAGLLKKEKPAERAGSGADGESGPRAEEVRKLAAGRAVDQVLLAASREEPGPEYFRLLVGHAMEICESIDEIIQAHGWSPAKGQKRLGDEAPIQKAAAEMEAPALRALLLEIALRDSIAAMWNGYGKTITEACRVFGVDLKPLEAEARKELAAEAKEKKKGAAPKKHGRKPAPEEPPEEKEKP